MIDFADFENQYQIPAEEFNVDYSEVSVVDEQSVRAMKKHNRMGDTGERFQALNVPQGSAQVEFEWMYESYEQARMIAHQEALNMAHYPNFIAVEPDFGSGTMRYFFAPVSQDAT